MAKQTTGRMEPNHMSIPLARTGTRLSTVMNGTATLSSE